MINLEWFMAIMNGENRKVQHLIRSGVDVNIREDSGMTGLHLAATNGRAAIARMLVRAGADVNAIRDKRIIRKETPLYMAVYWDHPAVIDVLHQEGVDINFCDKFGERTLDMYCTPRVLSTLIKLGIDMNAKLHGGRTMLQYLAAGGVIYQKCLIQILVDAGCDLSEEDLENCLVKDALSRNASKRNAAQLAMMSVNFPQKVAECQEVLDFIFLQPRS